MRNPCIKKIFDLNIFLMDIHLSIAIQGYG